MHNSKQRHIKLEAEMEKTIFMLCREENPKRQKERERD
jgi:hypothetical protein